MINSQASEGQSRREFLRAVAAASAVVAGCSLPDYSSKGADAGGGVARLSVRPATPSKTITPGSYLLTPDKLADGSLVVPSGYDPARPAPLVIALHGAGAPATEPIKLLGASVESRGLLLLAPGSRSATWDAMTGQFGVDVAFINSVLVSTFDRCAVDPTRIMLQGFSDGASYALGLGLANGDLFTHVAANSPGYIPRSDSPSAGKPRFFDSHGRQDPTLPIDVASRVIVPSLRGRGYDVEYIEFEGGHQVTPDILALMLNWFLP